jgi:hypothetical protein
MAVDDVTQRADFIDSLELEDVPSEIAALEATPVEIADDAKAGYVNAGSLVSFVAGMTAQNKSDVLNSTLLAQLAANKKFKREEQPREWYEFYREVLERGCGWVVPAWKFAEFKAEGATFSVDEVVLKILKAFATQNDIAVVMETVEALKSLADKDRRLVLFERTTHTSRNGNFQIAASAESDGVAVMKIGSFYFTTSQTVTRILWMEFKGTDTSLYQAGQTCELNSEVYAKVREAVVRKLGDNAYKFIAEIEI